MPRLLPVRLAMAPLKPPTFLVAGTGAALVLLAAVVVVVFFMTVVVAVESLSEL